MRLELWFVQGGVCSLQNLSASKQSLEQRVQLQVNSSLLGIEQGSAGKPALILTAAPGIERERAGSLPTSSVQFCWQGRYSPASEKPSQKLPERSCAFLFDAQKLFPVPQLERDE